MNWIAIRMLTGDAQKFYGLLLGIAFSTLLITQQLTVFINLIERGASGVYNEATADVWVMDEVSRTTDVNFPMPSTALDVVRSVPGVEWAVPHLRANASVRTSEGDLEGVTVIGVADAIPSFTSQVTLYTKYSQALGYVPGTRNRLSFALVRAADGVSPQELADRIEADTGLRARTREQFAQDGVDFIVENTGIPINFGIPVVLGFIVGSLAASVAAPLLDFGRLGAEINGAAAEKRAAFQAYRGAVYTALGDAEAAYGVVAASDAEAGAAIAERDSAQRAARLAQTRFDAGLADFLTVLEARRAADASGERAAAAIGRARRARVVLWQALTGDFPAG